MVSAILMFQSTMRLSISSIDGATYSVAREDVVLGAPRARKGLAEHERDLDLDARVAVAAARRARPALSVESSSMSESRWP